MFILSLLYFIFFNIAASWSLDLISIPFGDDDQLTYSISPLNKCDFEGINKIEAPKFYLRKDTSTIKDTLNYYQEKLNFSIDQQEISKDKIYFSLTGSKNIYFEFSYQRRFNTCKLTRLLYHNNKPYNLDEVDLEVRYASTLNAYVLDKMILRNKKNANIVLQLYPWSLKDQTPVYEFSIGPAVNIHTNIRLNDQNRFNKSDPAIEPLPAFLFRYGPFFFNKDGIGSLIYNQKKLSLLAIGITEGEPYRSFVFDERKKGIFMGFIVKYSSLEFTFYNDFFNDKGYNLKLTIAPEYTFQMNWKFSPQLYLQLWNNDYMDYYFGVTENEANRSLIQAYNPTINLNSGFMLETTFHKANWVYLLSTGIKFYGKNVYKSPTVDKEIEGRLIFSILYKVF